MAAMAVANYKRRTTYLQEQQVAMQKSEENSTKLNNQQSTQSNVPDHDCFTSSLRPTTTLTGEGGNMNGTKKWSSDVDVETINTKWLPSTR